MKIKHFFNKTSIRDFCGFWSLFNKSRIGEIRQKRVFNVVRWQFLYPQIQTFYHGLFFIILFVSLPAFAAQQKPHLRLVIGEYECLTNDACENGYCDIESHVCVRFPNCPECPECNAESCEEYCPVLPKCAANQHQLDGVCVECISNSECTNSDKPRCDMSSFSCQACPMNRPFWNGNECEACPAGTTLESGVCVCPSDKPYRIAACIGCESNKVFVPENNSCECPSNLPNWNADAKVCSPACTNSYLWSGTSCVECLTNNDCKDSLKPICNTSNTCESCPVSTPVWNMSTKKCESCPTSTPVWNTSRKVCEACPTSKPHWNGTKCIGVYTVTWQNMNSKTTQKVYEGDSVSKKSVSWGGLTFNYWAKTPGGSAVSFPFKITADTKFYAYYKTGNMSVNAGEFPLNKCGGSRLGSETTSTSKTITRDTKNGVLTYRFKIKLRSAWNNDGYNCSEKQGNFYWKINGKQGSGTPTTTQCTWLTAGDGDTLYIAPKDDWSKYCDVVWRAEVTSDLYKISYPY